MDEHWHQSFRLAKDCGRASKFVLECTCSTTTKGICFGSLMRAPVNLKLNGKSRVKGEGNSVSVQWLAWLVWIAPMVFRCSLSAAPLAWYPGPGLGTPRSGAATALDSNGYNPLIVEKSQNTAARHFTQ